MNSYKLLIFFLSLSIITISKSKWLGEVTAPDPIPKGIYKEVILKLTPESKEEERATGTLSYSYKDIVTQGKTNIDTHKSLEYVIYLGTSCESTVQTDQNYTIHFYISGDDSPKFNIENFNITFSNILTEISLESTTETLKIDSYGLISTAQPLFNVDPISLNFTKVSASESADVDILEIKSFDKEGVKKYKSKYYISKFDQEHSKNSFKINFGQSSMDKCFVLANDTFIFNVKNEELQDISKKKEDIVNTVRLIKSEIPNELNLKLNNLIIESSLLSCVIQSGPLQNDFIDDDYIRTQNHTESENIKFYQTYINEQTKGKDIDLSFKKVSRLDDYKLKCIFDTVSYDDDNKTTVSFTLGNFAESDLKYDFSLHNIDSEIYFKPICRKWEFSNFSEWRYLDNFTKYITNECDNILKSTFTGDKKYNENGCVYCKGNILNISTSQKDLELCVMAEPSCESEYNGNYYDQFSQEVDVLNSTEAFEEIGFPRFKVNKLVIFNDLSINTEDKISVKVNNMTLDKVDLIANSQNQQRLNCFVNDLVPMVNENEMNQFSFNYGKEIILDEDQEKSIELNFPSDTYDDKYYNVKLICFNDMLKEFNYAYSKSMKLLFKKSQKEPEDDPEVEKIDCSNKEKMNNSQCVKYSPRKLFEFISGNPRENRESEGNLFSNLKSNYEKDYLNTIYTEYLLLDYEDKYKKIIKMNAVLDVMSRRNCLNSPDYESCLDVKKNILNQTLIDFNEYLLPYNYRMCPNDLIDKINTIDVRIDTYDKLKLFLSTVFSFVNNPDSFDQDNYSLLKETLFCLISKLDEFLKVKDNKIKDDLSKISFINVAAFFDVLRFAEVNKIIINSSTNNDKNLIISDDIRNIKKLFEIALGYYASVYSHKKDYIDEDIELKFKENTNKNDYEEIDFDDNNLKVNITVDELFSQYKGKYIEFIIYKRYPYLSIYNENYENRFASIIMISKDLDKIKVENIDESNQPKLSFKLKLINGDVDPIWFDEKNYISQSGNINSIEVKEGIAEFSIEKLGDFSLKKEDDKKLETWKIAAIGGGAGVALIIIIIIIVCCAKKKKKITLDVESGPLISNDMKDEVKEDKGAVEGVKEEEKKEN